MIRIYACALLLLLSGNCFSQQISLGDLLQFTQTAPGRLEAALAKKSFRRDASSPRENTTPYNYVQQLPASAGAQVRLLSLEEKPEGAAVCYQTTARGEFDSLRSEVKARGFRVHTPDDDPVRPALYQQEGLTVSSSVEIRDGKQYFTLVVEKQRLPRPKDIAYAEDLLPLRSHELLAATFGENNVRQDVFHYSEKETNRCSVLFPNTPREVIFIWEDEANYRDISFLIIGGQMMTRERTSGSNPMLESEWTSRQGVRVGMGLEELQRINEGEVQFHGFGSEQGGMLSKGNKGKIDFNRLGILFSCLNCNGDEDTRVVQSGAAVSQGRRVYVSSMIVIPERQPSKATAAR